MTPTAPAKVLSLDDAIKDAFDKGQHDPEGILKFIEKKHGETWLNTEVMLIAEEAVRGRIRAFLMQFRRDGYREAMNVSSTDTSGQAILRSSKYVPDFGWKLIGELTAEDCRKIAAHYHMLASRNALYAELFTTFASIIEEEGAGMLGEVKRDLPLDVLQRRALEAI